MFTTKPTYWTKHCLAFSLAILAGPLAAYAAGPAHVFQTGNPPPQWAQSAPAAYQQILPVQQTDAPTPPPPPESAAMPSAAPAAPCGGCGTCETCRASHGCGRICDNLILFGAADGWKGPIDDDWNNNFGFRFGANLGLPLWQEKGLGFQFGTSYGLYDFHGRGAGENSSIEEQWFITTGLFHRCNFGESQGGDRISWGAVYDHMITDNSGEQAWEVDLGQFRGQIGYALDPTNEVGLWGAFNPGTDDDLDDNDGGPTPDDTIRPLDQISLFWRHTWCSAADTMLYIGLAEDPGEFVFGARGQVPLSPSCALFGGFHYILPSTAGGGFHAGRDDVFAEEFWNVSVGVAFYPGAKAGSRSVCDHRWLPLLPVADNGSFVIEAHPGYL